MGCCDQCLYDDASLYYYCCIMFHEHKLIISPPCAPAPVPRSPGDVSASSPSALLSLVTSQHYRPLIGQYYHLAGLWLAKSSPTRDPWPGPSSHMGGGHKLAGKGRGGNYGNAATHSNAARSATGDEGWGRRPVKWGNWQKGKRGRICTTARRNQKKCK